MSDLISRQAAIEALDVLCQEHRYKIPGKIETYSQYNEAWQDALDGAEGAIFNLPSAQPELPKQFMSDDCISRSELYKKVCEAEKLARERVLDTPSDSPFPNKLNPAYTRYSAQLNERTQFKHMIADATHIDSLWSGGQYGKIAAYFLKYADKTESTTGEHLGRKWNPSHGLRQPKIVRTVVNRMSFQKKVKARKGYHLEKDKDGNTVRYGISDLTGLPYLSYTMVRD